MAKKENSVDVYVVPAVSPESQVACLKKVKASTWHIDKEMLRFKLHYFLFIGGVGAAMPFQVIFARDRMGLSATSLGTVLMVQQFLFIFSKPVMGYVADYYNKIRVILSVLILSFVVCFSLLLVIPRVHAAGDLGFMIPLEQPCAWNWTLSQGIKLTNSEEIRINKVQRFCEKVVSDTDGLVKSFPSLVKQDSCNMHAYFISKILAEDPSLASSELCLQNSFIHNITFAQLGEFCSSSTFVSNATILENHVHDDGCVTCCRNVATCYFLPCDFPIQEDDGSDFSTVQFWAFSILSTMAAVAGNSVFTLSDTACLESMQKSGSDFGRQRLWGAIGWGAIAPLAGFLNDITGDYNVSWALMGVMLVLSVFNIARLDMVKPHFSQNILKDVRTVLKSREFLVFEAAVFINGLGTGVIWYYLIWFLSSIGGSKLLCGLALTIQSFLGSLPLMFISGWIIRKVGHFNVLSLSLMAYGIRFLSYSYLQNPWLVLPVEWLHGVSYGLYYANLASYGKMSAKPGTEATTQSLIFSTHEGLGGGLGCVIAGLSIDHFGSHRTFFFGSMCAFGGLSLTLIAGLLIGRSSKRTVHVTP